MPLDLLSPVVELSHHLACKQFEGLTDVLVTVASGLADEDQLVDSGLLVSPHQLADLVGGPYRPSERSEPLLDQLGAEDLPCPRSNRSAESELVPVYEEVLPDVCDPGAVIAEHVEVCERVAEEVAAVETSFDRGLLVLVAHERKDTCDRGIHRETCGNALLGSQGVVVVLYPQARFIRLDEGEGQGADALCRSEMDRLTPAAGDPKRRVWFLERLWHDVSR